MTLSYGFLLVLPSVYLRVFSNQMEKGRIEKDRE